MTASKQTIVHEDDPKVVLYKDNDISSFCDRNVLHDGLPYVLSVLGLRIAARADPSRGLSGFE